MRFRHSYLRHLIACSLLAAPALAGAQTEPEEELEAPPLYQVEIIVFRHLDQSRTTGEIPRVTIPEASDRLEQDLARLTGGSTTLPFEETTGEGPVSIFEDESAKETEVTDLNSEDEASSEAMAEEDEPGQPLLPANAAELQLADAASDIEDIAAYELITYLAWAQTAPEVNIAEAFELAELGADPAALVGTVELHERRYLHLLLDITLAEASAPVDSTAGPDFGFQATENMPALQDSRRIRLNRAQYFDQPQFGVLAMVSRYEAPAEDDSATGDSVAIEPVSELGSAR